MSVSIVTSSTLTLDVHPKVVSVTLHQDRFEQLVLDLKDALGPSSGLTSDDVDVEFLTKLMADYDSSDNNWTKYAFGDSSRGYTRNLVDDGNGKSNLLVLVWTPGKGSPIHDHGNAHCLMKILRGDLTETRYAFPRNEDREPLKVISKKTYKENAVAYMADELGLHRVTNEGNDFAVSLHCGDPSLDSYQHLSLQLTLCAVYTPPNVAKKGCHIFDEKTGRKSHVPGCHYHSVYGRLVKE
ncbi:cysteine dioxygenase [Mariannaea sp. PMI_226]|nr:cysteine dioxygenase [Mariannaea sp. PMI_226]